MIGPVSRQKYSRVGDGGAEVLADVGAVQGHRQLLETSSGYCRLKKKKRTKGVTMMWAELSNLRGDQWRKRVAARLGKATA